MSRILPPGSNQDYGDNVLPAPQVSGGGGVTSVSGTAPIASTGGATPAISITDFIASGASHARGSVPDPGATAGTAKFLCENATFQDPTTVSIALSTIGFKKRWRAVMGLNGSAGQQLPTSSAWVRNANSIGSQPPDWSTDWLSVGKTLDVSGAAAGAAVAYLGATKEFALSTRFNGGFLFVCRAGWHAKTATPRVFCGMSSNSGIFAGNPSAELNMIGFGADAADTQFTLMHNDGIGTATKDVINGGVGFPSNTNDTDFYEFVLFAAAGQTTTVTWTVTNLFTGVTASGSVTTDMPAANTSLAPYSFWGNGTTAATCTAAHSLIYVESNY